MVLAAAPLAFQVGFVAYLWWDHRQAEKVEIEAAWCRSLLGQLVEIQSDLLDVETGLRGYVLTGDPSFRQPMEEALADLPELLGAFRKNTQGKRLQGSVEDLHHRCLVFLGWAKEKARLAEEKGLPAAVAAIKKGEGKAQTDRLRMEIGSLREEIDARWNTQRQLLRDNRGHRLIWLAGGAAGAVLMSVFLGLFFSRNIFAQVRNLEENTRRLAQGESLVAPTPGNDEIARLAMAFQDMAGKLAQAQAATRLAEERFRTSFHQAPIPMILHAEDGIILELNHSWLDSSGYSREEIPTVAAWTEKAYGPEGAKAVRSVIRDLYDLKEPKSVGEFEVQTRTGGIRIWDFHSAPMGTTREGLRMVLTAAVDVTQRREAEKRLQLINQELEERVARRTQDLGRVNLELRHKNQELETFVYGVSHDLRSPLVNLQGFSKELGLSCKDLRTLLEKPEVPETIRHPALRLLDEGFAESLRFIETGVLRLAAIIDSLLRLSRAGRVETRCEEVDANRVVRRVVDALGATVRQRSAQVSIGQMSSLQSDATVLEQIFANLIGNALNYLDPNRPGHIEITERSNGSGEIEFVVRDNGRGIPPGYREKVFEAFQRLHPQAAPGEGMGLAIVRRLVQRLQGRIWLESEEGVGSAFHVALPVVSEGPATVRSSDAVAPKEPSDPGAHHAE